MAVQVDEFQNRMILSQRQVLQAELLKTISVGAVVEVRTHSVPNWLQDASFQNYRGKIGRCLQGRISWIEAYGAFVDIALPDGRTATGLVHKSELSWSVVQIPETVVSTGASHPVGTTLPFTYRGSLTSLQVSVC